MEELGFSKDFSEVYTDGACLGPPSERVSGCGVFFDKDDRRNISYKIPKIYKQTNQVAELMGIFCALQTILACKQNHQNWILFSDSKYAISSSTVWRQTWEKNGWKTSKGHPVENSEIIKSIANLLQKFPNIEFKHVPAHRGIPGNEAADRLAKEAAHVGDRTTAKEKE